MNASGDFITCGEDHTRSDPGAPGLWSVCYPYMKARGRSSSLSTLLGMKFEKALLLFQKANGMSEKKCQKGSINAEHAICEWRMWREKVAGQKVSPS